MKLDVFLELHTSPCYWTLMIPAVWWMAWVLWARAATAAIADPFFAGAIGVTVWVGVQVYPTSVSLVFGPNHSFLDFHAYVGRRLPEHADQHMLRRRYEMSFTVIANWMLALAAGLGAHREVFRIHGGNPVEQSWAIVYAAFRGIKLVIDILLSVVLGALVSHHHRAIQRMNSTRLEELRQRALAAEVVRAAAAAPEQP